jgi:hypothetical protein
MSPPSFPRRLLPLALASCAALSTGEAWAAYAPKVAVVLCEQTYATSRGTSQMSSQGLVGLAGLVGAPYETLTLTELFARPVGSFTSVWFSACSVLSDANLATVTGYLSAQLAQGGSVLMDGPIGAYQSPANPTDDPVYHGSHATDPILNVASMSFQDVKDYTVRVPAAAHVLSALPGWAPGSVLTQGLGGGGEFIQLANPAQAGSQVLLEVSNGTRTLPYLVTTKPAAGRVLAISSYGSDAGAATPFRNVLPRGFYDNLLLPRLIEAATWLLAGSAGETAVGLQLSHAPMTAVVRLDADQSDSKTATEAALTYLTQLARDTGVNTAYAVVSSFAQRSNWDGFAPFIAELEHQGGAVGSHSHTHNNNMSEQLDPTFWDVEVRQSLGLIRDHFTAGSLQPQAKFFINPGNQIMWGDYNRFFKDITTFFTHGYENAVPYMSGISAFGLPGGTGPVALFSDSPSPDYQWLYDPEWDYPIATSSAYQTQILNYFQTRVGRGALYNQMWHDYAINGDHLKHYVDQLPAAMFEANRAHFARERIFAPGIYEATSKMNLGQRAGITAQTSGSVVTTSLDLSRLGAEDRLALAGMGLRIDGKTIVSATVDGAEYGAFTTDSVILPAAHAGSMVVVVRTGDGAAATTPRLTYISKAATPTLEAGKSLKVDLAVPGLFTKFCAVLPASHVILGVDRYAPVGNETCGALLYGAASASFEARALVGPKALSITAADRRISNVSSAGAIATLAVAGGSAADKIIFRASAAPIGVKVGGAAVAMVDQGGGSYAVTLGTDAAGAVAIEFVAEPMPVPDPPDAMPMPVQDAAPMPMQDAAPVAMPDAGAPDVGAPVDVMLPPAPLPDAGGGATMDGATMMMADAGGRDAGAPDAGPGGGSLMDGGGASADGGAPSSGSDAGMATGTVDGGGAMASADGGKAPMVGAEAVVAGGEGCGCVIGQAPAQSGSGLGISVTLGGFALGLVRIRRRRSRDC